MPAKGKIITSDGDLEKAAGIIVREKFLHAGQHCAAPDYVLVQEKQKNAFVAQLMLKTRDLYLENSYELNMDRYCRIKNDVHFERLRQILNNAVRQGAAMVMGGTFNAPERIFHPTIFTDVPDEREILKEEIFGPILFVLTYQHMDELVHHSDLNADLTTGR
ncbi:aldehyde dehydrogenase family protein [Pedobacter hartonius]|uniref:Aldehyde dehydrogenase (NAD+) n=1 Tax=Pedobacter hartonius TaxID=425514 RepID=A0A1H4B024_9SPHI|nr:aldehyde dehydrogenase family protein [Pedobacter hartonius]SEA41515.1 aldehyde dehydrogenase (NAD+) [Pedobacter hartonius]